MKRLKQMTALLLCAVMLVGLLPVTAFAADAAYQFTIVADKTVVKPGDEVTFTVTMVGTEAVDQFGLMFEFDRDVFEFVKGAAQASYLDEDEEEVVAVKSFSKTAGREGIAVSFLESVVYSGKVGYITLKVKDNANFAETVFSAKLSVNNGTNAVSASINEATIFGDTETIAIDNITWYYNLNNNEIVLAACDPGVAVNITVPTTVAGYPVTAIAAGAFSGCSELEKVIILEGVTEVWDNAFFGCTALCAVTIPASVTSIGTNAFSDCTELKTVYYSAAKSRWNAISIASGNTNLTNATIHYNHTHDYTMLPPVVVEATCTQSGYTEYVCAYGEEDVYREYTPALGHDINEAAVIVQPTCTEGGYAAFQCARCDEASTTDHVPALGHDYSRLVEKVEPTCTEDGYSIKGCVRCEEQITTDYVDALGHDYSRLIEKVEPTCTEDGYSIKGCVRCEEQIINDYVDALGHHAVLIPMKDATCTEDGISRPGTMCDRCLVILVQPTVAPALGHDFVNGACSRCGEKDPNYFTADLNEDTLVDNGDVLTLLWHTLFPEQNPIAAPVDFNTDGKVDNDDVLTLLWHTLFPEQNPLGPPSNQDSCANGHIYKDGVCILCGINQEENTSVSGIWYAQQVVGDELYIIELNFDKLYLKCAYGTNFDVLTPREQKVILAAFGDQYLYLIDGTRYYAGSGHGGDITYTTDGEYVFVNCEDGTHLTIEKISEDQMMIVQSDLVGDPSGILLTRCDDCA